MLVLFYFKVYTVLINFLFFSFNQFSLCFHFIRPEKSKQNVLRCFLRGYTMGTLEIHFLDPGFYLDFSMCKPD